jgi:hypothetical protein
MTVEHRTVASVVRPTLLYISSEAVIPAKAGIQPGNTGFPRIKYGAGLVKPGMTIKVKGLLTQYTSLKAQLSKFSGILSKGFKKPKKRLIKEMLYGIEASKDVKLSNISRILKEGQALIKTEDRLSRNLDDEDFTDPINEEVLRLAASRVTEDMVIAIGPGDLRKRYAKKMEFLDNVRDGSENEMGKAIRCVRPLRLILNPSK